MSDQISNEMKMEIHLDEETAQGVYVNMAAVNHTGSEFVIDFIFAQPQAPRAKVRSRVITSPAHVKRLIAALHDNLQRYEKSYGTIDISAPPQGGEFH